MVLQLCNQMGKWMGHLQNLMDLYAGQLRLVHPRTSPTREGFVPFRMWAFPRARIKSNLGLLGSVQLFV